MMIITVSDSLGETVSGIVKANINQFPEAVYEIKSYHFIRDVDAVEEIISEAVKHHAIVIFTVVMNDVATAIREGCEKNQLLYCDVMAPILNRLGHFFQMEPLRKPGVTYRLDESYFSRIKAIEFAVKYDDGKDLRGLKHADLVLIGISRTSKTPLSMYLSHKNINVANLPLVPEIPVAPELYAIDKTKIIGLTNSPNKLNEIRTERLRSMGLTSDSEYASSHRIMEELQYADRIYKDLGCPVINVANKAIEETASIILDITGLNKTGSSNY